MVGMACTLVFAVAALAAAGAIVSTLRTYGADVRMLRVRHARGVPEWSIVWRILEVAPCAYDGTAKAAIGIRASRPERQPRSVCVTMQPSLAA